MKHCNIQCHLFSDLRKVYSKTLHTSYRATKSCVYLCSPMMCYFTDPKSHTVYIPYISLVSTTLPHTKKKNNESFAAGDSGSLLPSSFHLSRTPDLTPRTVLKHQTYGSLQAASPTIREAMLNREDFHRGSLPNQMEDRRIGRRQGGQISSPHSS